VSPRRADREGRVVRYRAITWWVEGYWRVRVENQEGREVGHPYNTVRHLHEVDAIGREIVDEATAVDPGDVQLDVDVALPDCLEVAFETAQRLIADASAQVDGIVAELLRLGVAACDVVALLQDRPLRVGPGRPLVMRNAEIASCGLAARQAVVAVRWDGNDGDTATWCRGCVETDRSFWVDDPGGTSALIYHGPVHCDGCGDEVGADTANDPMAANR
jgi:hypothetical protein